MAEKTAPNFKCGLFFRKINNTNRKSVIKKNVLNDEEEDDNGFDSDRTSLIEKRKQQILKETFENDPTISQYDEVYDEIENQKSSSDPFKKIKQDRTPQYMENLLKSAAFRKREDIRRNERKIQKERQEEGDQFADKEVYVTESYKQKLEELQKEEESLIEIETNNVIIPPSQLVLFNECRKSSNDESVKTVKNDRSIMHENEQNSIKIDVPDSVNDIQTTCNENNNDQPLETENSLEKNVEKYMQILSKIKNKKDDPFSSDKLRIYMKRNDQTSINEAYQRFLDRSTTDLMRNIVLRSK